MTCACARRFRSAGAERPLSATRCACRGRAGRQLLRHIEIRDEGLEVAVVDADQARLQIGRPLHLGFVMDFHQRVHPELRGFFHQRPRGCVIDHRQDDQDGVGAPAAGFGDLIGLQHEILAQHRQAGGFAGGGEEFRRALEGRRVGQDGETGGAAGFIGHGDGGRIEIGADQAFGRAGLLHFRDQAEFAGGFLGLQRGAKAAHRIGVAGAGFHLRQLQPVLGVGDFLFFVGENLVEDAHDLFDTITSCSSLARAAPLSRALRASSMPDIISFARPATIRAAAALSSTISR